MNRATVRNLVISLLCLCVTAGGFSYMVIKTKYKEQELQAQQQALSEEQARESSYYALQKIASDSTIDRDRLSGYFLKQESDSINVLNWIEQTAKDAQVKLETKNLQKVTDKDTKTDWIEIQFVFSGTQDAVERFAAILERLPYLSYLTTLSMSVREGGGWEASVMLRVSIAKYDK